ncbi:DNA-directed DNA polymerase [Pleurotus pulmonarius]|nr:DNA-directed DNA polymerase [Pleurotus pulmonarius]
MSTTLPLFWHLSSNSKQERIDASLKLITALNQFQAQFTPKPDARSSGDDESEKEDAEAEGLDALNAHDVVYSIRRLIRGLSSPRESSRLGFAVALTELLSQLETVTCSQILSLILDNSKPPTSATGQEERDSLFARLFGLTSVIQSRLLVNTKALSASASSTTAISDIGTFNEVISQLLILGEKKSWLRESAWWSISLAVDVLEASDVPWKEEAVKSTIDKLLAEQQHWSPEKIALALKLQTQYPAHDWKALLAPTFKNPQLLSNANLLNIARIMKACHEDDENEGSKSVAGGWKPQIHFAWKAILDRFFASESPAPPVSFQEFFRVVVDESLFASNSSPQRKYWGFQVFQAALPRLDGTTLSMLFTKNFMRTWINHLSHQDRYLHKAAKQVATDIQATVKNNPQLGFALVLQLTGVNGNRQFDRLTKTKTVETILISMDAEGIQHYIEYLFQQMVDTPAEEDIQGRDARRSWVIDQIAALVRNGSVPKNDKWVQDILDWLVVNGLFVYKKATDKTAILPTQNLSDELRQNCRTRLLTCLGDLTNQVATIKGDAKSAKIPGVASDGQFWVCRTLSTITKMEGLKKYVKPTNAFDEENKQVLASANEALVMLQKKSADQMTAKGAELLLAATVVQQYCAETPDFDTLSACVEGITKMFPEKKKKSKKEKVETTDPEPIDILVDVIIGFMERSTNYLRTVGTQVFGLLSESVTSTTVDLILTQLERRDPAPIDDEDEDDGEDQEDEDDGEALTKDDQSEDEEEDDEEDEDEEQDLETRRKIEDALRANGLADDEDEDEDLMDDDQMMAIDEQLAEIFRSRANEKHGKDTNAQREATHFKNRVLDLVEMFIKKQLSSQLVLRFILPLADLVAGCGSDEQQLADKARGILQSRISKAKELPLELDVKDVTNVLSELHIRARKPRYSSLLVALSQCSLYASKILIAADSEAPVLKEYKDSLTDFMTRKGSAFNPAFFQDFIQRFPSSGWKLGDDLLDLSSRSVNIYRQCQAYHLVHVMVSQLPNLDPADRRNKVESFMPSLRKALYDVILSAAEEKLVLSTPQMKELFKLGLLAERQTSVNVPDGVEAIWLPETWTTLQTKISAAPRYKSSPALATLCGRMAKVTKKVTTKRKATEATGEESTTPKPKRKKK